MYSFQTFCCLITDHPPPVETANCLRAACPFIAYYLLVRLLLFCLSLCYTMSVLYFVNLIAAHCPRCRLVRSRVSMRVIIALLLVLYWCYCMAGVYIKRLASIVLCFNVVTCYRSRSSGLFSG